MSMSKWAKITKEDKELICKARQEVYKLRAEREANNERNKEIFKELKQFSYPSLAKSIFRAY